MKQLLTELFEIPLELYCRGDQYINEKIRPITQKLDSKDKILKYILGNNALILQCPLYFGDIFIDKRIPTTMPIGISTINFLSNFYLLTKGIPENNHKGYEETDNGNKLITDLSLYKANSISKSLRFTLLLEGIANIGIGSYQIIKEKDLAFGSLLLENGFNCLNTGFSTYLIQSDDDEPRKKKDLFPSTKENLETIIGSEKSLQ